MQHGRYFTFHVRYINYTAGISHNSVRCFVLSVALFLMLFVIISNQVRSHHYLNELLRPDVRFIDLSGENFFIQKTDYADEFLKDVLGWRAERRPLPSGRSVGFHAVALELPH